ncbi:MAG TPA: hypothetical protein VFX28_21425 [Methylomirabilota bacterium]|nr:hypothetical protein [Methylomirabilota bacterium]
MRRLLALMTLLLLAVVQAPTQAQALMYVFFPDIFTFGTTNEPAMLLLTGLALLSLAGLGRPRPR